MLAHGSADPAILAQADQNTGTSAGRFNGDDAVLLRKAGVSDVIDSIGQVGVDSGTKWGSGDTSTADNTLRRKDAIEAGDDGSGRVYKIRYLATDACGNQSQATAKVRVPLDLG